MPDRLIFTGSSARICILYWLRMKFSRRAGSRRDVILRVLSPRERLLVAAYGIIAEESLSRPNVDRFADRAGLSRQVLFLRFPGKAPLLSDVPDFPRPAQARKYRQWAEQHVILFGGLLIMRLVHGKHGGNDAVLCMLPDIIVSGRPAGKPARSNSRRNGWCRDNQEPVVSPTSRMSRQNFQAHALSSRFSSMMSAPLRSVDLHRKISRTAG